MKILIQTAFCWLFFSMLWQSAYAEDWPEMPFPKQAKVDIVSQEMLFNGIPMKTWSMQVDMSLEEAVEFYRRQWKPIKDALYDEKEIDSAVYINSNQGGFLLTAKVTSQLGRVSGVMGISHLAELNKNYQLGENFPLPRGSIVINDIFETDPGAEHRYLLFHTQQSVASSYRHFLKKFTDKGWRTVNATIDPAASGAVINLNKNSREANIVLQKLARGTQVNADITTRKYF